LIAYFYPEKQKTALGMEESAEHKGQGAVMITDMYENWYLDYASYVILERAVPAVEDGLKPVQRRILHAMKEMDDGRFNKVANIIGQSMQYHPHGDASIGDAIVGMGQRELLIETQGNWGDTRTGDPAAAPRYIEARLSKFALEVAFNAKTTEWQLSYDGRKYEPVTLPMKFPLLLAQGTEGIAVGLATKILPHNFCELIDAAVKYLQQEPFELYPDFLTGGMIDVANYNDGVRGGKIKIRVHIEEVDKKTLAIKDVPYGIYTTALVDSILKANDSGKIKIKSVVDNTAKNVELLIQLAPGISPDQTIDALYAFTECETSVSPNACIIIADKPHFVTVSDMLRYSVDHTKHLLLTELQIKLSELEDDWHYSSLEKIFIENRIYRDIEEETTWEGVLIAIDKGLDPFKYLLRRTVTKDDIINLTEIKIKRISKYDTFKADEHIRGVEKELENIKHHIANLTDFTIQYYLNLLKKYGKGRERRTEIRQFDTIQATTAAIANTKLYANLKEGFIGTSLKKDEFVLECSDIDQIIVFRRDGKMMVTKVAEKVFLGKDIIHVAVFQKNDERTTYNMIYVDGASNVSYCKRFNVTGVTRDKEYDLTKGNPNSKVLYFSSNANGEAEIVTVVLSPSIKAKSKSLDFNFEMIDIKARSAFGNQVTKHPVKAVKLKQKGISTLSAMKIWYDAAVGRLNKDQHGRFLGMFEGADKILVFYKDGCYEITDFELTNRFDNNVILQIEKFFPQKVVSAVYFDAKSKQYFLKRFMIENQTPRNKYNFVREGEGNYPVLVTTEQDPTVILKTVTKKGEYKEETIVLEDKADITGWKTVGTFLTANELKEIVLVAEDAGPAQEGFAPTLF
jgi:topoisomerase IV subunit A